MTGKGKTGSGTANGGQLSFEEALERLGEVVAELEAEEIGLERSIALFTEGRQLAELCHAQLGDAEERVQTLLKSEAGYRQEPGLRDSSGRSTA